MPKDDPQSSTRQETLTVLCKVEREDALRGALSLLRPNAFVDASLGVHFARLVLVPADPSVPGSSAWLAFESNFDTREPSAEGARAAHLDALAAAMRDALSPIFAACEGLGSGA